MKPQDIEDLKQLIEFLKEHQIAEFDLDRGDLKIRLKFSQQAGRGRAGRSGAAAGIRAAQRARRLPRSSGSRGAGGACCRSDAGLHMVKSPIVGTFYGSPSPGASSFVAPAIAWKRAR